MFRTSGWAAFLASSTLVLTLGFGSAAADASRPIYACFSPQNAALIGRLGANDESVRYGFESGACLALAPNTPIGDVERTGNLWRFHAFGAAPYLFAADWGAGFAPPPAIVPAGFERYLPVTSRLLSMGRASSDCFDASDKLNRWGDDLDKRWTAYWRGNTKTDTNGPSPIVVVYVSDTGPKLIAEMNRYRREEQALRQRCSAVASFEADRNFITFTRSARYG